MLRRCPLLIALALTLPTVALAQSDPGLRDAVEAYDTDRDALRSFYDGPPSPAQRERMATFLGQQADSLPELADDATLAAAIDRHLLETEIGYQQALLDRAAAREASLVDLLPFADDVLALVTDAGNATYAYDGDPRGAADVLAKIKAAAESLRPGDGETPPSATDAKRAAERAGALRRALEYWFEQREPFDPVFAWWVAAPYAEATAALDDYVAHLYGDVAGLTMSGDDSNDPLVGDPIGREALLEDLEHEMIPYTPEQLVAIALRELEWCREQQIAAAQEMGLGDDWRAATEQMKGQTVGPGEQDEQVRRLAEESIAFLDERDLVTIPDLCRETWRLRMVAPRNQRIWPFGAYGGQHMLVSYAASEMDHARKIESMRGNAIPLTRTVVQHELIPGHHLQRFVAERSRPYRSAFSTPFYVEGWALYWEMLLWDLEFPRTPEERLGMLLWRSHRSARIVVSLGFHLGQMTPPEMIDYLVDEIGLERDGATAEVRRYIGDSYSPLYQCAYLIGGLQLRSLSNELVNGGDEPMTYKQFHDAVLAEHSIPFAMVRAALLDLPADELAEPWAWEGEVEPAASPATKPAQ